MKKRILLICPHSATEVFKESKISVAIPHIPYISLASLAGVLIAHSFPAKILDLSVSGNPLHDLDETLENFQPDFVGVTFTSGLCHEASIIAAQVKNFNPCIKTVAGGAHASIFPSEPLEKYNFDFSVFGEGEITLLELVSEKDVRLIAGLGYKGENGETMVNEPRELIKNLDELPFPALHLYNSKNYHSPKITAKKSPVVALETSRGCPFNCIFCSKHIFQRNFRVKSAKRVVDEMEMALSLGYKEVHIWDDCFSADLNHPKRICDEIIRRKLKLYWNVYNGIRVDRVDEELLVKLKQAGCYRVSFGIESGDQKILDRIKKGVTLEQIRRAVELAKKADMEVLGFFIIGLPDETVDSIKKTINFAISLDLDLPKVSIATPLPGTEFFSEWEQKGLISSYYWPDYVFHSSKRAAGHPNLKEEEIFKYYNLFWRRLFLRPRFIWRRFRRSLKNGEIFFDIYYFLKVFLRFKW